MTAAFLVVVAIDAMPSTAHAQRRPARVERARARRRPARHRTSVGARTHARRTIHAPPPDPLPPAPRATDTTEHEVVARVEAAPPEVERDEEDEDEAAHHEEDRGAFEISAATHAPISIGASIYVRPPTMPVFARAYVGWVPEPYVAAIDEVLVDARAYDAGFSPHVRAIATSTTMASFSLGVAHQVLDVAAGYTLLHRAPHISRDLVARVMGQDGVAAPGLERRLPESFPAEVMVHMVHLELGARMVAFEHLVVRLGVRWDHAIAANADVSIDAGGEVELQRAIEDAEAEVGERLATFTFFPSLVVALGYQF
ncbi:hypothetical protein [Sandaracinus amylolyticus]|uniref:hypothetical protein n=1 Tax=Sandaracinus amylolyticus TaxID=927083 RepID=UPI001F2014E6|nr:hypothetical protein [Sandaracinus amylolyticus]UJR84737.1 Hypothetical protein I5071_68160 [Sandaracinus amylolyticus]